MVRIISAQHPEEPRGEQRKQKARHLLEPESFPRKNGEPVWRKILSQPALGPRHELAAWKLLES